MIRAKFAQDPKTGALKMSVRGHANAGKKGEDLVCAAASILAYTAAQDVTDLKNDGRLSKTPVLKMQSGRTMIEATATGDAFGELLHTLYIVQKGFVLLAANNPKYVRVSPFKDVNDA